MYIPSAFEVNDKSKLVDFIKKNSFGILFSQESKGPFATHLPFLMDENAGDNGVLLSHMAKSNPHWKDLHDKEVLVVFPGSHAYISASWYNESHTVPTWNYVAVHVYGKMKIVENKEDLKKMIEKTVNYYESSMPNPWNANFDDVFIEGLMNSVVGIELEISKIEGQWKLSQNHSVTRQQNLINGLKTNNHYDSQEIARFMEQNLEENN